MTERRASSADRLTGFWDPCGPIASGLRPAESDFEAAILGALTDSVPPREALAWVARWQTRRGGHERRGSARRRSGTHPKAQRPLKEGRR